MFQIAAFQTGFQSSAGPANDNNVGGYTYQHENLRREEERYKKKLKRQKSELEKVNSVLAEYEKQKAIAAKNKILANKKLAAENLRRELEYAQEINRLLQVRALLLQQIRQNEDALIIVLIAIRRRRLIAA